MQGTIGGILGLEVHNPSVKDIEHWASNQGKRLSADKKYGNHNKKIDASKGLRSVIWDPVYVWCRSSTMGTHG